MRQTITATQARDRFAELINRVAYRGEEFVVEKQGKPAALITRPYASADFLTELSKTPSKDRKILQKSSKGNMI